jgi:SpoVK/Ycf46/Vps4 family AAA+-type ATPase
VYNLIACQMKVKDYAGAEGTYKQYGKYLNPDELLEIAKELKARTKKAKKEATTVKTEGGKKDLPTKTKSVDGSVKEFGWFKSDTKFSDVIGLDRVKAKLNEKLIGAMVNPELYARYGGAQSGGIMMYGSPGCGKSLLARAVCGESGGHMLIVNISEVISKYMGSSSSNLSLIFSQARDNTPALIFIDEIDSVAQSRAGTADTTTSPEERRILDTFLTELDGVQKNNKGVFILASSNIPWVCDSAFLRSGRIGKSVYINSPILKDRVNLFKFYMKNKNHKKISYTKLGFLSFGFSCSDISTICENAATRKAAATHFYGKKETPITTRDLISQILEMGRPTLPPWFQETAIELKKLPSEKANQYAELRNEITFWEKGGKQRLLLYKIIGSLIP